MLMLIVKVHIKPDRISDYIIAVKEDASDTMKKEDGNFLFSVSQDKENPELFFLVEIYKDNTALDFHRESQHFIKYRDTVTDMYSIPPERYILDTIYPTEQSYRDIKKVLV